MTSTEIAAASKVMLGITEADAMYIGSTLIWQQSSSSLPYDCLVEYLESTGTLWIDTGYKHHTGLTKYETSVVLTNILNNYNSLFGSRITHNGAEAYYIGITGNGVAYSCIGGNKKDSLCSLSINTRYNIVSDPSTGWIINGTTYSSTANNTSTRSLYNCYLYSLNQSNTNIENVSMRIYHFVIYEGNTLIMDLIPVRVGQVGYMYDRISGLLLGNSGTGSFKFGPDKLPDGLHDYSLDYFTIESLEDNNEVQLKKQSNSVNPVIYYSLDNGNTWNNVTVSSNTTIATINTGDTIIFKSEIDCLATSWDHYNYFDGSKQFKVYGNVMSLLNGDNFLENSEFATNSTHNLTGLLRSTKLVDASELILPALTLKTSSYNGMFRGCTNLTVGPKVLPALDVPTDCYSSMFEGCTSLVEAPEILATTVSGNTALNRMFCMNRNSKVTAAMTESPIIRITNPLAYSNAFQLLFAGNGNITKVTILTPGTNLNFSNWMINVSSSGTIYKLSASTFVSGNNGVPSGWTTAEYIQS